MPRDAITVQVEKGWITLTGEVDWHYQKDNSRYALLRLHGVIGISDRSLSSARSTPAIRSEEHTSEIQSLMRNSYAVFCLKKKIKQLNKLTTANLPIYKPWGYCR